MKRVAEIRLSEDDDLEAVFPPEYERIIICADTVRIEGHVHLPGRMIDIYARSIDPHPVRDRPATLDVSGCPGVPDFDPDASSPELNGSPTSPDGRPGQAGGDGQNAGQVSIVMDRAEAAFEIAANGAKGGNSQRGGDGTQPVKVDGADSVIDSFASQYKIPARAANGNKGAGPGKVPSQPTAKPGQPGKPEIEQVSYNDVNPEFDLNFLQLVLARADRDSMAGKRERALQRCCWLVHLTGSRAKDDEAVAQLRDAAQHSIDSVESDRRS